MARHRRNSWKVKFNKAERKIALIVLFLILGLGMVLFGYFNADVKEVLRDTTIWLFKVFIIGLVIYVIAQFIPDVKKVIR